MVRRTLRKPNLTTRQEKMLDKGLDPNATGLNWNVRRPTQGPVGLAIKNRMYPWPISHRAFRPETPS
jgi:hypothetical protein